MIDRKALDDPAISLKAKGLLAYLLAKPPDWRPRPTDICTHCTDGLRAIHSAFRELKDAGYARLMKHKTRTGVEGSEWSIFESPEILRLTFRESHKTAISITNTVQGNKKASGSERFEEVKGGPNLDTDPLITRSSVMNEIRERLKANLKLDESSPYWNQWMNRAEQAPWRVELSLCWVEDDLAVDALLAKERQKNSHPVLNPSGKANWYFLNMDLETGKAPR